MIRNANDLLRYLVKLSDDPKRDWVLNSGSTLVDEAHRDGLIEWTPASLDQVALWAFQLVEDGSLALNDLARHSRRPHALVEHNDLAQARELRVKGQGRRTAAALQPTVSIQNSAVGQFALGDIANVVTLVAALERAERYVEDADAPDEAKDEARGRLRAAREALENVGTGAAGDLLASALRAVLRVG